MWQRVGLILGLVALSGCDEISRACDEDRRVLTGSFVIESDQDLEALLCTAEIRGDLEIKRGIGMLRLPNLARVEGALSIEGTRYSTVYLPKLVEVGDLNLSDNDDLKVFLLPSLASVDSVDIHGNSTITELSLYEVTDVDELSLTTNEELKTFRAPRLSRAETILVESNPQLTTLGLAELAQADTLHLAHTDAIAFDLPKLSSIKTFYLLKNAHLETLSLPFKEATEVYVEGSMMLRHLDARLERAERLTIKRCRSLKELPFNALTALDELVIDDNDTLTQLTFPALTLSGALSIQGNASLCDSVAEALVSALGLSQERATVSDNLPGC